MHQSKPKGLTVRALPILAVLALLTALALAPAFFRSEAQSRKGKGLVARTGSHAAGIPNYDIRLDKKSALKRGEMRRRDGLGADVAADVRDGAVAGEEKLRSSHPQLKIEYAPETGMPEIIGPDAKSDKASIQSARGVDRASALRGFLRSNESLLGLPSGQVDELVTVADYKNPEGNMSWVILEQKIDNIPVFRGEVVAGFGKDGSLARVVNGLAAGVEPGRISREFDDPRSAVTAAAGHLDQDPRSLETDINGAVSTDDHVVFGDAEFGTVAAKIYFPLEPGTIIPAWRVLIRQRVATYNVIVDARSGELLWRKNLTEDQTQMASYRVYSDPDAMAKIADSPFPITPGPTTPSSSIQGAAISRTLINRIGNESPYEFNSLGWLTDGSTTLDGNNVQAGLDRENPNEQDTYTGRANGIDPNGVPSASSGRTFDFPITPATPSPTGVQTGSSPLPAGQSPGTCLAQGTNSPPTDFQKAVTTQLFYITNVWHDETYRLGFTEQARNFQTNNFGRGGSGNDRISAQSQDCDDVDNANFATPPDGIRPSMQMYIWTAPAIDIDGSLDADIVIHELTHGLSGRLHSNASGLNFDFSRGMGEGWSDFYAHAMLSKPTDPIDGIYSTVAYATYQIGGPAYPNSYYGIRRFPKAIMASTGGPNNRPHNPMTFQDIDATKINLSNGAFSPAFSVPFADGVHAAGEVWSSALWEVRALMVQRMGWEDGNRRVLQLVTDGMKLSPINPNFISGRDAIIAAARAGGSSADVADVWQGFAIRGIGFSASVQNNGGISADGGGLGTIRVTEAFDLPNLSQAPAITFSDTQDGDGDGLAEPGETLQITIPISNLTGNTATNVMAQLVGSSTLSYGTIADNGSASNAYNYTVPSGLACGNVVELTINVTSSIGPITFTRTIPTGELIVSASQNFDGVTAPAIPGDWQVVNEGAGGLNPFRTSTTSPNSPPNAAFAPDPDSEENGHGSTSLTSPSFAIQAQGATVSFRHRYNTEASWDGGVLEISIDGGAYQDILAAGGQFLQNGYNGFLNENPGGRNPIELRNAWTGNSGGYVTTIAQLPASAAGKNVTLRWRFGTDENTGVQGWWVDDISLKAQSQCSFVGGISRARADFDGDGRTDFAIFRPSDAMWYILFAHGEGFTGVGWGANGDIPVPADYDNDGKTDAAVYRPGQGGNASYFYALRSSDLTFAAVPWGIAEDVPVVRDYDGDHFADFAVYRPSTGVWYVYEADGGFQAVPFGAPGVTPVAGDFDGDEKADFTIISNGVWYVFKSSTNDVAGAPWGLPTDVPVPADYDGDGADDFAVFRPSDGMWWVLRSSDFGFSGTAWGLAGDVPIPGDYDGDGKNDPAIYRDGIWAVTYSSTGTNAGVGFGTATDIPVANAYIP